MRKRGLCRRAVSILTKFSFCFGTLFSKCSHSGWRQTKNRTLYFRSDSVSVRNKRGGEVSRSHKNPLMASVTFVYCVETAKDTAIVAMECE